MMVAKASVAGVENVFASRENHREGIVWVRDGGYNIPIAREIFQLGSIEPP
jgi:hypothetical protein